jgi:hypothetical protein
MNITREQLNDLKGLQEDMASHFVDDNFPISGETYWTCVECLAIAKLAELRGELNADPEVECEI